MPPVLVAERDRAQPLATPVRDGVALGRPVAVVAAVWRIAMRHRVTGLAAEAGFFALLSLPPLLLSVLAGAGTVSRWTGSDVVAGLLDRLDQTASVVLPPETAATLVVPLLSQIALGGRLDVVSLGFLVALWSGSRALNVYVDTIAIMYGHGGRRGIVRTRALSFSVYVAVVAVGVVVGVLLLVTVALVAPRLPPAPLAPVTGSVPQVLHAVLPIGAGVAVVAALAVLVVATLYQVATPVPSTWGGQLPGAAAAVGLGTVAGLALHQGIAATLGSGSLYGPLAAPVVVLLWLYLVALSILVGAALNAAIDEPAAPSSTAQ